MKKIIFFPTLALIAHLLVACGSTTGGTETGNAGPETVAPAMGNSIDAVSDLGADNASFTAQLFLRNPPHAFSFARLWSNMGAAYAVTDSSGCTESDANVTTTIDCNDTTHSSRIAQDFGSSGCDAGNNITVTGAKYTQWNNMGNTSCVSSSTRPRFFEAVRGSGATQILSTSPITGTSCDTPSTSIARHFSDGATLSIARCVALAYTNFSSSATARTLTETLNIGSENRIRVASDGTTQYSHSISTPTPLSITMTKTTAQDFPVRTISAGSVRLVHNLAAFTVTSTFTDVKYDYNVCRCQPISGSMAVAVVDNRTGATLGTGTITFTAETTGTCDSLTATYKGAAVTPTVGSCRGL